LRKILSWLSAVSTLTLILLIVTYVPFKPLQPARADSTSTVYVDPANVTDLALTPEATTILRPDGDGTWDDWTYFGGGNYDDWDEADPHDGDSTYVWVDLDFAVQSSTLDDPPANTWAIAGVRVTITARTTDPLSNDKVFPVVVTGAMSRDYWGFGYTPTTEYRKYTSDWAVNPDTSDYWTWADIASLEAGAATEAVGSWTGEVRVTQLYVEVLGPRLTVDIRVDEVTDLWLYEFELTYNPDILQGVWYNPEFEEPVEAGEDFMLSAGASKNQLRGIPGAWNNTLGRLSLSGAWLNTTDTANLPDGAGTLSTAVFWVRRQGETKITLGKYTSLQWLPPPSPNPIPIQLEHGYFRNVDTTLMPTASFTKTPEDTPPADGPLRGFNTNFTSTSTAAMGRTITTHKWYFWKKGFFRTKLISFTSLVLRPDGDGTETDWAGSHTDWDDVTPDKDTTHVSAGAGDLNETSTLKDYAAEAWPISKVAVTALARQTGDDERMRLILLIGGDEYHSKLLKPTKTFAPHTYEWGENPATSSPWTWSDINALEAGVKSVQFGPAWAGELRVTQLYIEVSSPPSISTNAQSLLRRYTIRGTFNVTLSVIDDADVVGTTTGLVMIKSHDISFTKITTNTRSIIVDTSWSQYNSGNFTEIGDIVEIEATAINEGDFTETFDVSTFWSIYTEDEWQRQLIGTQTGITLGPSATQVFTFNWDTAGRNVTHPEAFVISANVSRVPYEHDIEWTKLKAVPNEYSLSGDPIRVRHHDVSVTDIHLYNATGDPLTGSVTQGETVEVNVTIVNQGDFSETSILVTAYYDGTPIGTQTIPLLSNKTFSENEYGYYGKPDNYTTTLQFLWDTTGVPAGDYTITAKAIPWFAGDCDRNGDVDALDLYMLGKAYHPSYNANCDFNRDGKVDDLDLLASVENYGGIYEYDPHDNTIVDGVVTVT